MGRGGQVWRLGEQWGLALRGLVLVLGWWNDFDVFAQAGEESEQFFMLPGGNREGKCECVEGEALGFLGVTGCKSFSF